MLIEDAAEKPLEVIQEVFSRVSLAHMLDELLPNWLRTAIINDECPYSDGEQRSILMDFYYQLLPLIEALFVMKDNNTLLSTHEELNGEVNATVSPLKQIRFLSNDQVANPMTVLADFFELFSKEYIRRELWDFLEAGVGLADTYPNDFTPWQAFIS